MNYTRLGLIFCAGLVREGKVVAEFYRSKALKSPRFFARSARCQRKQSVSWTSKKLRSAATKPCATHHPGHDDEQGRHPFQHPARSVCGHDSMVFKYSAAPCTVLAAKDRVFGTTARAVYTMDSYYAI